MSARACECPTPAHCIEATGGEQSLTADELELVRLRRELAEVTKERDALKAGAELWHGLPPDERSLLAISVAGRIVDEVLGPQEVLGLDDLLTRLERLLRERDQLASSAAFAHREAARLHNERAWLVAALEVLVADHDAVIHEHNPETCSRTSECDAVVGNEEECSCYSASCLPCECGLGETIELVDRVRALLAEVAP